jgi:hypothetical protein
VQEFQQLSEREKAAVREEEAFVKSQARGSFRTIARPSLDQGTESARREIVCASTLKISHAHISVRLLVLKDPPARLRWGIDRRRRQGLTLVHFSAQPEPFLAKYTP